MGPAELTRLLDDVRPAVQSRTLYQLGKLGNGAIAALDRAVKTSPSGEVRRNAVWALTRIQTAEARDAVRSALADRDESVRKAALHSAGLWRDAAAVPQLIDALKSGRPAVQRAAAEALGRIGDPRAVPDLLTTAAAPLDRVLEHSVTYALIEIADPVSTAAGLRATSPHAKRAALIALDQMDAGGRFFQERLTARNLTAGERDDLQQKLVQFGESSAIQEFLAATVERAALPEERVTAFRAMARTRAKELPSARPGSLRSCARWPAAIPRSRATRYRSCARRLRRARRRPR
jgi:hypothetical protein